MTVLRHDLTVVMRPIESITRHPENYNHGDVEAITESLEVIGLYTPVWVQKSSGYIVVGNHRWEALLGLGETQIPVIELDVDDNEARRILAADNKLARLAMVDINAVHALLAKIMETDLGLIGTGYVDDDLRRIAAMEDAIDEPFKAPEFDGVLQRSGQQITCPACGHQFGGRR